MAGHRTPARKRSSTSFLNSVYFIRRLLDEEIDINLYIILNLDRNSLTGDD